MPTDLTRQVREDLAAMNHNEQLAYTKGLSVAYTAVFQAFIEAFDKGDDIHELFYRIKQDDDNRQEAA